MRTLEMLNERRIENKCPWPTSRHLSGILPEVELKNTRETPGSN